MKKNL
jgi:bifunctional non-homologous end joining protein LigD